MVINKIHTAEDRCCAPTPPWSCHGNGDGLTYHTSLGQEREKYEDGYKCRKGEEKEVEEESAIIELVVAQDM